eukprot:6183771-Pleurochrysis_carterae.AAC.4
MNDVLAMYATPMSYIHTQSPRTREFPDALHAFRFCAPEYITHQFNESSQDSQCRKTHNGHYAVL